MKKMLNRIKKLFFKLYSFFYRVKPIYYLNSSDMLKPPLNKDEEEYYLNMLSINPKEAHDVLIERNLRLVIYIAKKFDVSYYALEDLVSIGTIGLIKAVNTFDPSKNIKLATYASKCIENEILMYLRKNNKLKNEISLDEPLNADNEGNELILGDVLSKEDDNVESHIDKMENVNILNRAIEELDDGELKLINYRFGLGGQKRKTQKEIADMMNISQSYISRLEKKVIKRLKKEIYKLEK